MFRHYLQSIFRTLFRNKLYSLINLTGLAFGMSCFLLILVYVQDELRFDRFHSKGEKIYRIAGKLDTEGLGERSSSAPFPVGKTFAMDHPQLVEQVCRFFNFQEPSHSLRTGDKVFNEDGVYFADSTVLEMFNFKLLSGHPGKALDDPNSILITEELAEKYFGKVDVIGEILVYDGVKDLKVSGILAPVPGNSHIRFDALISFSTLRGLMGPNFEKNWVWNPCWTYLLLKDGVGEKEAEAAFPAFVAKYYPDFLKEQVTHHLQALYDIHLNSHLEFEMHPNGNESTVYVFLAIGLFILLIACINYTNMAIAGSAGRARETGIRKVVGANRKQLVIQYLLEAIIISFLAVVLALTFIELLLPWFNELAGKEFDFNVFKDYRLVLLLVSTGLVTGFLAGMYPAFVLSSFVPVKVLKSRAGGQAGPGRSLLRKGLVVFQFTVSMILIIATIVVGRQLDHLRSKELGFEKEQVMMIPVRPPMVKFFNTFIERSRNVAGVKSVSRSNDILGKKHNNHEFNFGDMKPGEWIYFPSLLVDEDFVETMGLEIIAGRDFSKDHPGDDSLSVLINEAMLGQLGWTAEEAIGKDFYTPSGKEKIIGVLKNFHFVSVTEPVRPFVLDLPHPMLKNYWTRFIPVRTSPGNFAEVKTQLQSIWKELTSEYPFEFFFLSDELNTQYRSQEKLSVLVSVFSGLAVFIACLGLFALVSYSAGQRTREIGVRKVLGAGTANILLLLCREFLALVFIAILIAVPAGYMISRRWLETFASHIGIGADVFVVAAILLMAIAFITVIFKALQASRINPARALRYE